MAELEGVERITARYYCHQKGMEYGDGTGSDFALMISDESGSMMRQRKMLQPDEVVELLTHCIEVANGSIASATQSRPWPSSRLSGG